MGSDSATPLWVALLPDKRGHDDETSKAVSPLRFASAVQRATVRRAVTVLRLGVQIWSPVGSDSATPLWIALLPDKRGHDDETSKAVSPLRFASAVQRATVRRAVTVLRLGVQIWSAVVSDSATPLWIALLPDKRGHDDETSKAVSQLRFATAVQGATVPGRKSKVRRAGIQSRCYF